MIEAESVTVIKYGTSYLCVGSSELSPLVPKVVKLCTTSPPPSVPSVLNTILSLSKLLATLTFLSRVS